MTAPQPAVSPPRWAALRDGPVVAAIAFLLGGLLGLKPVFDYDLFWHLANGREMLASGEIVSREVFSFTHPGAPFKNQWWLAQLLMFGLWSALGPTGLVALKVLVAGAVSCFVFLTSRLLGAGAGVALFAGVLAVLVGIQRYVDRPELFTLLLLAALAWALHAWRDGRSPWQCLAPIPPLMVVWDWLHGALFGLVYLLGFVISVHLARRLNWRGAGRDAGSMRSLNLCLAATLLAMLANPWGLASYGDYLSLGSGEGRAAFKQVLEFTSSTWTSNPSFIFLFAITALGLGLTIRRIGPTGPCLFLGFGVLAWEYIRVTGVYMIVSAPYLAAAMAVLLRDGRAVWQWSMRAVLSGLIALSAAFAWDIKMGAANNPDRLGMTLDEQFFPVGAVRVVKALGLAGNGYNTGHFGGYLAFHLYPDARIFQYNFPKVFGDSYRFAQAGGQEELARWNIAYGFVGLPNELQLLFPSARWARIYRDPAGALVLRRTPENQDIIARFESRWFHPGLPDGRLSELARNPQTSSRLIHEALIYLAYRRDDRIANWLRSHWARNGQAIEGEDVALLAMASSWNEGLPAVSRVRNGTE